MSPATATPRPTFRRGPVLAVLLAAALATAGCNSAAQPVGNSTQAGQTSTPTTTTAANPPTPRPSSANGSTSSSFAEAVTFTKAVFTEDWDTAKSLVASRSAAARYVTVEQKLNQALQIDGTESGDADSTFNPDPATGTITINSADDTYIWRDFTYDSAGHITSWTGKSGPISNVLWTKDDQAEGLNVTATMQGAYKANSGYLFVVVDLKAATPVNLDYGATYSATGGYTQQSYRSSTLDSLSAGDSTLAYYAFKGAKFGGKMKLKVSSNDFSRTATLTLNVN